MTAEELNLLEVLAFSQCKEGRAYGHAFSAGRGAIGLTALSENLNSRANKKNENLISLLRICKCRIRTNKTHKA